MRRRDRFEILLSLHHSRELREVRLQPVLLVVLVRRVLQVRDHLVEVVLELIELALRLNRDLSRQVTARHCSCYFRDGSHLDREAVRHRVHVVGQCAPRTCCVRHFCLTAKFSFGTYFLRNACYFVCEDSQRVHHGVDRILELEDLTAHLDGDLLRQVSVRDSGRDERDVSNLTREVSGQRVHVVREVLPRSGDSRHFGLSAEVSFRSYLSSNACYFGCESGELIDHRVDRVLQLEDLALHVDRHLSIEITARHCRRDVGDVSHLAREVRGHEVHVVREILPRACDTRHTRLPTEPAFAAYFARDARYFGCEHRQRVDHRVDRVLELENLALHIDGDLSRQVTARDGCRNVGDVSNLTRKVRRHGVHVVGQILPRSANTRHTRLTAELSFGSYFLRDSRHFVGECGELIHHRVDRVLQLEHLTSRFDGDLPRQVSLCDGGRHVGDVSHLTGEVAKPWRSRCP